MQKVPVKSDKILKMKHYGNVKQEFRVFWERGKRWEKIPDESTSLVIKYSDHY